MEIKYIPRRVWGSSVATEEFIRKRTSDPSYRKTEIHVHHTAAIDVDDDTPNRWDYSEAVAYMRRLQWARPDLGPLPYSENIAVSEDTDTVWVFQGRGILKRGAHTARHNVAGVGWGILGNFDKGDNLAAHAAVAAIESRVGELRQDVVPSLGNAKNPRGWNAWGHRDSSSKSCPGFEVYTLLRDFDLEGGLMSFSAHEIEELKRLVKSLDSVDSNGGFASYAVKLIRKERNLPLHEQGGTTDAAAHARLDKLHQI